MVCSIGSVKMAVLSTLSASGNFSQAVTEKAGHQKLVAQYIQKELLEADDANLLDEEDMHIFDMNPLTDPLHLVCCKLCKKPVKANQFIFHAELCRSLGIAQELLSGLDNGTGNRKPPRKERKKLVTAGKRVASIGGQERLEIVDVSETAVSRFQMDEQTSSCLVEAKGTSRTIGSSVGKMNCLTKRPKLIAADSAQPSDELQTARGGSNIIHIRNEITYMPAPLAAKTYYSQRNNRLQASLSHMYHQGSTKESCLNDKGCQGNLIMLEASSCFPEEHVDDHFEKSCNYSSTIAQTAHQNFRKNPELSLSKAGDKASDNLVNQFSIIEAYTSQDAGVGATTTRYCPTPSFAGGSGTSLTTIRRSTGSVPVV